MARADARMIRFVRALLPDRQAFLDDEGRYCLSEPDRTARLPKAAIDTLVSEGVLIGNGMSCHPSRDAVNWLRRQLAGGDHAQQHRTLLRDSEGAARNLDESPLARLAAPGRDGSPPFLLPHQVEAGERMRRLVERAQMVQRTTMSYDATRTAHSGGALGAQLDVGERASDARRKLAELMRALPADCSGVVFDVCGLLKGLQAVEAERGWPRRSAKLVLRVALDQVATHFGLSAAAVGSDPHGVHVWLQERPSRFE